MSKELVSFYGAILETAGLHIVDGVVHQHLPDDGDVPVTVSKKTLVLPTDHWLGKTDIQNIQYFHPISENVIRKESTVFKFLRRLVVINSTSVILELMQDLIHILSNKDTHSTLDPITQLPLLRCAPEADKDFSEKFEKIIDKIDPTGETAFLSAVILRGKSLKDKDYTRIAKISFPLLHALENPEGNQVFGVKLRKKDISGLINLIYYILPDLKSDSEFYSTGSRSGVAPSLHALLSSYAKLIQAVNVVKRAFGKGEIALAWLDDLTNLADFKGLIPKLPGNDGEPLEGEEKREERPVERLKNLVQTWEEEDKQQETLPNELPKPKSGGVSMANLNLGRSGRSPSYRWMEEEDRDERGGYSRDDRGYGGREEQNYRRPYGAGFSRQSTYGGYSNRSRSSGRGGLF